MAKSQPTKTVIAFDLYGTLLSTESIAQELAELFGDDIAKGIALQWRRYQLEYTWRINSMGMYRSFSEITRAALRHAVAEKGLSLSDADVQRLMGAYDGLKTFPDIGLAMQVLENEPSIDAYVFSNGTDDMVSASMNTSPELSKMSHVFGPGKLVTVGAVKAFKPDKRTYDHFVNQVGMSDDPSQVWLVSSNPFDALGARVAGLKSAWIDRAGTGWIDALGSLVDLEPTIVSSGVDEAVKKIIAISKK